MTSTPLLRTRLIQCGACHGSGKRRHVTCPDCLGRGYHVMQRQSQAMITPQAEYQATRKRRSQKGIVNVTHARRREDVLCLRCGSPALWTETLCKACSENHQ